MCECSDSGCKAHEGQSECDLVGTIVLYRIDMEDLTGTLFCDDCASDAMDSGLFTEHDPEDYDIHICPVCDGEGYNIGALGRRTWYRCESCGMEFNYE